MSTTLDPGRDEFCPTPGTVARTILLFGEILADVFPDRTVLGGAPFNVARHLAAFGQRVVMVSRVGADSLGEEILRRMREDGMDTSAVQVDAAHPTGRVRVALEGGVHRFDILPHQAYDFIEAASARGAALSAEPALVYFGTLCQRHEASRNALRGVLAVTPALRFVDINLREPWYDADVLDFTLRNAAVLKINADELQTLATVFGFDVSSPEGCARELARRYALRRVIVTCGESGAWQMDRGGETDTAGGVCLEGEFADTVGAGDAFAAVCILGLLRGWPGSVTLGRANGFAAAICGIRGAVPDRADFHEPFAREWSL